MATNTCRPNHFSRLSASDDDCLILEVIFFIPFKVVSFSIILYIVIDCLFLPSLDFNVINGK